MLGLNIALAQIDVTVGDLAGNTAAILDYYTKAVAQGADLVLFPELAVTGYPPQDLVFMPAFRAQAMEAVRRLAAQAGQAGMVIGSICEEGGHIYNCAFLLSDGTIQHRQPKSILPNHGVFDEKRIFTAGEPKAAQWRGKKFGILVCEDTWGDAPAKALASQGAQMLLSINASPFEQGKFAARHGVALQRVKDTGLPLAYVNIAGGQDDVVYDGGSFVLSADGGVAMQMEEFTQALGFTTQPARAPARDDLWRSWEAMKLGLRDYLHKNRFTDVVIGLSGGIDSALTAAVAADALGGAHVHGVLLPSPYTSKESTQDAEELAKNLGVELLNVPITPGMQTMEEVLNPVFHDAGWMENIAVGGNLQARLRGLTLMALSNKFGWMLLSTGNKSEIAVGYSTLYGDSCGGYNVIKDLYKTQVYALARWRNAQGRIIPERSITRAPSAELKPGQKDQDQLPPYDVLDAILAHHIEGRLSAQEIIEKGFDSETVRKVLHLVRTSEYKRRQSVPGVKLSPMMFGSDRRYPLTNAF